MAISVIAISTRYITAKAKEVDKTKQTRFNRVGGMVVMETTKKWFNKYLPILEPKIGEKEIAKKLKIDEKKAEKLYKKWRYAYVNRIM